jgi:hypothetical protein
VRQRLVEVADAVRVSLLVTVSRVRGLAEVGLGARRVNADLLGLVDAFGAVVGERRDFDGEGFGSLRAD